jgi:ABC-type branched-subunit amino acid transport system substrate-binding protein
MRTRFRRSWILLVALAVMAAGVSGIPASAAAAPVTVNVHVMGSETGGLQPLLLELEKGVKAAQKPIEKQGAVKFDVTVCDAKGDANALRKCGTDAVADHADAVISADLNQVSAGLVTTFQAANIPVFWVVVITGAEEKSPISMLPTAASLSTFGGIGVGSYHAGFKKGAVLVRPNIAQAVAKNTVAGYEGSGGTLTDSIDAPFTIPGAANPPDLAPIAQKVLDDNPKVVMALATDILQQLRSSGYTGPYVIGDPGNTAASKQTNSLPADVTKNYYKASQNPPFDLQKDLPVTKRFKKEMKAVGEGDFEDFTSYGWNAWQSMYAIADQVTQMQGDITGPALTDAFNASKGIKLVSGPTWVPSAPGPPASPRDSLITYWFSKYVGKGKWKLVKTPNTGNVVDPSVFADL